ncbi:vesicle transport protein [Nymphaea thermarum]|nr:vesicle transport protein [Nymphaea thermarum]
MIARVTDGLTVAEGLDDGCGLNDVEFYKHQAKNLLTHCYSYIIEGWVCYLTWCDRSYPNKLAFQYVLDLKKEFERVNGTQIETAAKPYAFTSFGLSESLVSILFELCWLIIIFFCVQDAFFQRTRKLYLDTRSQHNLVKLNDDLYAVTHNIQEVLSVEEKLDLVGQLSSLLTSESRMYARKAKDSNQQFFSAY